MARTVFVIGFVGLAGVMATAGATGSEDRSRCRIEGPRAVRGEVHPGGRVSLRSLLIRCSARARVSVTITSRGAVHPNLGSAEFSRTVTLGSDPPRLSPTSGPARLTITAAAGDPYAGTRWTWERVPPVENLSPAYRQVAGFWEHVVEKRINLTTGAADETTRAPSVIVYTPSGYVGVHFPPRNRAKLASDQPSEEEARAALAGYIGYFGALTVYPGQVFHHPLANIGLIANGNTIKRFYEVSGDTVTVTFPATTGAQGQQTTTSVTLKWLSGIDAMM